jgi:hypothetical protein
MAKGYRPPPPAADEIAKPSSPEVVAYLAQLDVTTSAEPVDMRNPAFAAGYRRGFMDAVRREAEMEPGELAKAFRKAQRLKLAFVTGVEGSREGPPGETPAQKSARLRRARREVMDHAQAAEFARLIQSGETSDSARKKMGNMGDVRARRIRKLAVRLGLLKPHQQTHRVGR